MNVLSRLALLLFALVLLPGAPAHAHMMASDGTAATVSRAAVDGKLPPPCHDAPATMADSALHQAQGLPAGAKAGSDCCSEGNGTDACGAACACPSATPALPAPACAVPTATPSNHQRASGSLARGGPAHAPPNRPPIG